MVQLGPNRITWLQDRSIRRSRSPCMQPLNWDTLLDGLVDVYNHLKAFQSGSVTATGLLNGSTDVPDLQRVLQSSSVPVVVPLSGPAFVRSRRHLDLLRGFLSGPANVSNLLRAPQSGSAPVVVPRSSSGVPTTDPPIPPHQIEEVGAGFAQLAGSPAFCVAVLCAIDGCHIWIKPPAEDASCYFNRKLFTSIQLQAICDHRGKFIDVQHARLHNLCLDNGASSGSTVWSLMRKMLKQEMLKQEITAMMAQNLETGMWNQKEQGQGGDSGPESSSSRNEQGGSSQQVCSPTQTQSLISLTQARHVSKPLILLSNANFTAVH
ncbi:hypothetical protein N1851_007881 [Merluccius polli]|uniref:DDE Tnp4 domain-containing protein n=1 Tax=Merluccius polli TaxID=89951 RepID=A0AA47N3E8_MERPO|nr:hypothetical protein N1851_007881 [Merluccius polli]